MNKELMHNFWLQKQDKSLHEQWMNKQFIQDTLTQIQVDFAKFNLIIEINDDLTVEKLETEVQGQLQLLNSQTPEKIPQLIYTIDLPEVIFSQILAHADNIELELAKCIIVREAMKVYLRSKFSKA